MDYFQSTYKPNRNVGVISTRLAGTDGVSLETEKLVHVLEQEGFNCFYFAGELDRPPEKCYLLEEAHFNHPRIQAVNGICFSQTMRGRDVTLEIQELKILIKDHLYRFIEKFNLGGLLAENCLTIPMNIPLGLAITELIAETNIVTIAHHHDFYWERDRFMNNAVSDYLNMAFPPNLPSIRHTVINSHADEQLSLRTGISARVLPNIMDFENPPQPPDDYTADIRQALGVGEDELLILQLTRVVELDGYVTEDAIDKTKRILEDADYRQQMVEHNYRLGNKFFSYKILRQRVRNFLSENQWLLNDDQAGV
jgi:hypothetical protein